VKRYEPTRREKIRNSRTERVKKSRMEGVRGGGERESKRDGQIHNTSLQYCIHYRKKEA
jgi:hypothetical protein